LITRPVDVRGKLPPGPTGHFLIGSLLELSRHPMDFFARCSREYGDIVYLRFLHVPVCIFSHPRDIEYVLLTNPSNFVKTPDYHALRSILGNGILTAEGGSWGKHRKLMQPAFRHESITAHAEVMVRLAVEMIESWRDGQTLDIHQQMMALTLDVVAQSLLGTDLSRKTGQVGDALGVLMEQFMQQGRLAFVFPRIFPLRTRSFRRSGRLLDEIICEAITQRRKARGSANDLLEMLLCCQDGQEAQMGDEQLRDEVKTLILTGHETTANALSWTWYLLAQHPDAEAALQQELATVLEGRVPTANDLGRLPYTEMVVKEALRLYPATWAIGRQAIGAFETGGFRFPAGMTVAMLLWNTHRDHRFFLQPDHFCPERWSADSQRRSPVPRFAYLPFGGGPRVCIGAGFAMMEATLLLATMAQRFSLSLAPNQDVAPMPAVTLRPKDGIRMVVHRLK